VQDLQTPDRESALIDCSCYLLQALIIAPQLALITITSTWSDSNLPNLFKAGKQSALSSQTEKNGSIIGLDDKLRVVYWILNLTDDPFFVDIGKGMTVQYLKKAIKKEREIRYHRRQPTQALEGGRNFPVRVDDV
jgi:hypothetical protein